MRDSYGRSIDYLRISITDRCNLRCRYCMPEPIPFLPHAEILRFEEIERICAIGAKLGIHTLKITGGEPLVREGCTQLMGRLKRLPGVEHVTLTTNGVLLGEHLPALAELGADGVNISLDTLEREAYQRITGQDALPCVLAGLQGAVAAGLRVKINCVPLAETGMDSLLALAELAKWYPVDVRFIELMPIGHGQGFAGQEQASLERSILSNWPELRPSEKKRGFGPAHYYTSQGFRGAVGFIDAVSHAFCGRCNRLRLTSEGFLKLCLCHGEGTDLRSLLRAGAGDRELEAAIRAAIERKPAQHSFGEAPSGETRSMSQIGG